ncbi:MAG: thioesterase family protein [Pseudomonadota bacterium]|nr:thioesterase family protein [Pseudomonadota bacterium]
MLEIKVRSTHIDVMGHVNNAKYVEFLEWGRVDEIEKKGIDIWEMVKRGLGFAVVNLNIHYRKEAFTGDILLVKTIFKELRNRKVGIIDQVITKKGSADVVCEAEVTFLIFDINRHKSITMPEELSKLLPKASND